MPNLYTGQFIGAGDDDYAKTRIFIDAGNCPDCGKELTPCQHTDFHGKRAGNKTAGDCLPCGTCYTLEKMAAPPVGPTTAFDLDDERVMNPLRAGNCPDCGTKLIPCAHIPFHVGRGDDTVHGDCQKCRACWTEGPER